MSLHSLSFASLSLSFFSLWYSDHVSFATGADQPSTITDCQTSPLCSPNFQKQVFATSDPIFDRTMTSSLFTNMESQGGDTHTCGLGSKYYFTDSCSEIHQPSTPFHNDFGLHVAHMESVYTSKWSDITSGASSYNLKYDSFFDNSVAYWSNEDLSTYFLHWTSLGMDLILLTWYADLDKHETHPFFSLITHHPSSLSQYELISDKFDLDVLSSSQGVSKTSLKEKMLKTESRAYFYRSDFADYTIAAGDCTLYPIGSRRSVTNIEANVAWYKKMFAPWMPSDEQIILGEAKDYKGDVVKYAHLRIQTFEETDAVTVSFFQRTETSTSSEMTVKQFEDKLNYAHTQAIVSPMCGIDRWFDLHFGMISSSDDTHTDLLDSIMLSGELYSLYTAGSDNGQLFIYMPEPNGHSVQVMLPLDDRIEWIYEPETWDNDWCPTACQEGNELVKFGEIVYYWNDASESELSVDKMKAEKEKDSILFYVFISGLCLCLILAGVVVFWRASLKCGACEKKTFDDLDAYAKDRESSVTSATSVATEQSALLA